MKYLYPAIITKGYYEDDGTYCDDGIYYVNFPDLEACHTDGATIEEALEMAEDVLPFTLKHYEDRKKAIPVATDILAMKADEHSFTMMIKADTDAYRRMMNTKSIRKNISIPEWMDIMVKERNINLSNFVQQALQAEFATV